MLSGVSGGSSKPERPLPAGPSVKRHQRLQRSGERPEGGDGHHSERHENPNRTENGAINDEIIPVERESVFLEYVQMRFYFK